MEIIVKKEERSAIVDCRGCGIHIVVDCSKYGK